MRKTQGAVVEHARREGQHHYLTISGRLTTAVFRALYIEAAYESQLQQLFAIPTRYTSREGNIMLTATIDRVDAVQTPQLICNGPNCGRPVTKETGVPNIYYCTHFCCAACEEKFLAEAEPQESVFMALRSLDD
jgi:hypothetical protein